MKILIHREKRQVIDGKEQTVAKARQYYVTDLNKNVGTLYGEIDKKELSKPSGSMVKTDKGKEFILLEADFIDTFKKFRKLPQTIPLKDIGLIISETGMNKNSEIVDGGAGSGALAAALANIAKKVTTYDVRYDHLKIAKQNVESANLKNIEFKNKSLYDGIEEKDVDVITLDLPEPWKVLKHASESLRIGGWLVSYSPSVPQVQDFVNATEKETRLMHVKTVELIERLWEIRGRRVRPKSTGIGHSGFLTFLRKITN